MRHCFLLAFAIPLLAGSVSEQRPHKPKEAGKRFRLELRIDASQPGTFFTAWADGDVIAGKDASDKKTVTYRRKFYWSDGCRWESTERLTPTASDRYTYAYSERATSCPRGRTPDASVTRTGRVFVFPTDTSRPLTPLEMWAPGWEQPQ